MSNPFAILQDYGDQDNQPVQNVQEKSKKTRPQKKNQKKQAPKREVVPTNEDLPTHPKSNVMAIRDRRQPPPTKGITQGHTHDRRSGTGRVDKVRKQGGGWGGIGNVKDVQNKEKYIKEGQQQVVAEQAEQKIEQPPNMTLQQYYLSKGINISNVPQTKQVVKKTQINADWIKKEKLTVLETKEDLKKKERTGPQTSKKQIMVQNSTEQNNQLLGFTTKASKKRSQKPQEGQEIREKNFKKKQTKKEKIAFNQDDFPAL